MGSILGSHFAKYKLKTDIIIKVTFKFYLGIMTVKILGSGTSQGVPVIGCDCNVCTSEDTRDKRLRVSVLVSIGRQNIIIDTGPDFRQQMLSAQVESLEGILLTHEHNDHIIGIDDVRSFIFRRRTPMPVYANARVVQDLKDRFAYAFRENPYPGSPRFDVNIIDVTVPFSIDLFDIQAIKIWHGQLPILGFRINNFAYLTDIKTIETKELGKLKSLDVLIISALQKEAHHSHATLDEALALIKQINPRRAFITHLSHKMGCHEVIEKELPKGVKLAFDGMELSL